MYKLNLRFSVQYEESKIVDTFENISTSQFNFQKDPVEIPEINDDAIIPREESHSAEYIVGMNNSVIIKGSDTISNQFDPNMLLSFAQS